MKRFLWAAIILAPMMTGLSIAADPDRNVWKFPTAKEGTSLTLRLPSEVTSLQNPTKMDFQIVDFQFAGKTILSLYLGNAPQRIGGAHGETINGLPAQSVVASEITGISRATLVTLPQSFSWPTFAQFFYKDSSKAASVMADAIIASFRVEPAN